VVGIVVVSHSSVLAEGVVDLAREMGGPDVPLEPAGGLGEPQGAFGTDAELVRAAIERARSDDGVLVLMDLGSAVMSAEMAAEMLDSEGGGRVLLCEAPLVEGAVAAAAAARAGGSLDEVAAEARAALRMKAAHLADEADQEAAPSAEAAGPEVAEGPELSVTLANRLGLHARPAARFVAAAGRFDAEVSVTNVTKGRGPASGRSLTGLATLNARQGDEIRVRARGEEAEDALEAIAELAAENFGDVDAATPEAPASGAGAGAAPPPSTCASASPPLPPASGERLSGVPAAPGIATGPARLVQATEPELPERAAEEPEVEWRRLEDARSATRRDLERDRVTVAERAGEEEAGIFDAHVLMLDDEALLEPARRAVFERRETAERAWLAACSGTSRAGGPPGSRSPVRACWWLPRSPPARPRRWTASRFAASPRRTAARPRTRRYSPARWGSRPSSASGRACSRYPRRRRSCSTGTAAPSTSIRRLRSWRTTSGGAKRTSGAGGGHAGWRSIRHALATAGGSR
jgi:multiphosphoryl transfer protein